MTMFCKVRDSNSVPTARIFGAERVMFQNKILPTPDFPTRGADGATYFYQNCKWGVSRPFQKMKSPADFSTGLPFSRTIRRFKLKGKSFETNHGSANRLPEVNTRSGGS
jgi:hypothetical protein